MKYLRRVKDGILYSYSEQNAVLSTMEVVEVDEDGKVTGSSGPPAETHGFPSAKDKPKAKKPAAKKPRKKIEEAPAPLIDGLNDDLGRPDELQD